eukprot:4444504-Alexandrium_andersonii.AAC.1
MGVRESLGVRSQVASKQRAAASAPSSSSWWTAPVGRTPVMLGRIPGYQRGHGVGPNVRPMAGSRPWTSSRTASPRLQDAT